MNSSEQKKLAQNIDKVLKSKTSQLSAKDIELLVVVREGIRTSKTEKSISKYIKMLMEWLKVAAVGIKIGHEYWDSNKGG
ncbi:MAG: hypothetical protein JST83_17725 [Bacteroidetes bacterium]|nr:hypothetical protein [Bacteroidota bacterium]